MFEQLPATVIAALAVASGVHGLDDDHRASAQAMRDSVGAQVRQAQVELYCDHPAGALLAIRRAVRQLEQPGEATAREEIVALERAAWHVRRNETGEAMVALGAAMGDTSA